jgi:hypothetical protein
VSSGADIIGSLQRVAKNSLCLSFVNLEAHVVERERGRREIEKSDRV